jgi:hypothetical protein
MKWLPIAVGLAAGVSPTARQTVHPPQDSLSGIQSDATSGLLHGQATVTETSARERCLSLPVEAPNDRLQGPHGDSLVTTRCEAGRYRALGTGSKSGWFSIEYRWLSLFTAEDTTRGPAARDTVTETEVVLLGAAETGLVRPIWHERFETGAHAIWRSVTPEIAKIEGSVLLSVEHCVNGTGGCSQDFLERSPSGQWTSVRQVWLDQLPRILAGRIQHGVHIDVGSLRGEGGLYGSRDPNCCPSQLLRVRLGLRSDSLVLRSQTVVPSPRQ